MGRNKCALVAMVIGGSGPMVGQSNVIPQTVEGAEPSGTVAHATHIQQAPQIDGILDEPMWATVEPITDFVQRNPVDGANVSERTEVKIAYDQDALYFGMVMHDANPQLIRRSILHREGRIDQDDRVIIALDTYHDRRNAYIFELNPFGTQGDALITDETMRFADWNWEGVYRSEGRITDQGWVLEVAIPFTTIRFSAVDTPQMGIAFYRSIRRKNEEVLWPHISQEYLSGIFQVSQYATLTGLQNLRRGRHLEVKPYAILGGQRFDDADTDVVEDAGLDIKYSVTSSLTVDLTYNTDFAQVEADNVQINLTRFNLFFPEKREFFLERAGLFGFGDQREAEVFFSRRVGLDNEIIGGGRLTGQVGPFSVGLLNLQTDDGVSGPGANNGVARVRTDVTDRATIGGIFTNLQNSTERNRVVGVDGAVRFWSSSSFRAWSAKVFDPNIQQNGRAAGAAELLLRNDRYTLELAYTNIGENYRPGLGFVNRRDQIRFGGQLGFTPRFEQSTWARRLSIFLQGNHIEGHDGIKQSHFRRIDTRLNTHSGDNFGGNVTQRFERLDSPFEISPGTIIPPADYTFSALGGSMRTNESRPVSGSVNLSIGDFFHGTRSQYGGRLTWKTGPHLTLAGSLNRNVISLPVQNGDFSTTILGLDIGAALNRKVFANALVQYDDVSNTLQSNIRVNWIHTPGSDMFFVIDTGYRTGDLLDPQITRWERRTGVVKLTYLKAF